ncbi:MAG: aminotransferase class I/II-fold pyridoxal phosphate-dependent enzyme [Firmicutes bacterium]|nr:aminotransferase class I/II-fold pyridoxal phosphate-dependent enzyme [Bacillota bacterium]
MHRHLIPGLGPSQRAGGMPWSGVREILDLALQCPDPIRLEVGEPTFPTPEHIVQGAVKAAQDGYTKYTANAGLFSLRTAIAKRYQRLYGVHVEPEQVIATAGGITAIATTFIALTDLGDSILLPNPCWPNYEMLCALLGLGVQRYPLQPEAFIPDIAQMEAQIDDSTRVLVVNSPANPTGAVFSEDILKNLLLFAQKHGLFILADEVYDELVFTATPYRSFLQVAADEPHRVVIVNSFSKTYAMTGWRVGYAICPQGLSETLARLQEAFTASPCAIAQKAAETALEGPQEIVAEMRETYRRRRDMCLVEAEKLGLRVIKPEGTFYMMIDITESAQPSRDFAKDLLMSESVAVAPGDTFGPQGEGFIRISLASKEEDLREGLRRIQRYLGTSPKQI